MSSLPLRRLTLFLFSLSIAVIPLAMIYSLTLARPQAGTITVNPGESIQAAIDAATPGDTILINAGTYTESLTLSKAVNLTGVNSATVIINALPNQRVLTVSGVAINSSVIISGFTLAEGNAQGTGCPAGCGGGIFVESPAEPHLQNLLLLQNKAEYYGGGLYFGGDGLMGGPLVTLTHISAVANIAAYGGGAFLFRNAFMTEAYFEDNVATSGPGGGLYTSHNAMLEDSTFVRNRAAGNGGGAAIDANALTVRRVRFEDNACLAAECLGGGLYVWFTANLIDTQFIGNTARHGGGGVANRRQMDVTGGLFERNACLQASCDGGGLWTDDQLRLEHTRFVSNTAQHAGGGAWSYGQVTAQRSLFQANQAGQGGALSITGLGWYITEVYQGRITNSAFIDNDAQAGAALHLNASGDLQILYTTITDRNFNSAAAVEIISGTGAIAGKVGITNTLIVSHAVGISRTAGAVHEDYNLFSGNGIDRIGVVAGAKDLAVDPQFSAPANDDYRLGPRSPAIDRGFNQGVVVDFDNFPRPVGGGFDLGAYEYQTPVYYAYLPHIAVTHISFSQWLYIPFIRN